MKKRLYSLLPALLSMPLLADAGPAQENNMMRTLSFFGIVLAFVYLILWRPEQKRRKKMQNMRSSLKPGDKITAMGIVAEIAEVKDQTITIKVDGAKIEMLKAAISEIHQPQEAQESAKPAQEESEAVSQA